MSEFVTPENLEHITYFRAPDDNRVVAILVRADFAEFDQFPPFMDSEAEKQHIRDAYDLADPESELHNKAHLTDDSWPLQMIVLQRDPGGTTKPHYHIPDEPLPAHPTRHQVVICQRGSARIGISTTSGDALGEFIMKPNDMVLFLEGHSVEFLEKGTRMIEIKQGPFPVTDTADKVDLVIKAAAQ